MITHLQDEAKVQMFFTQYYIVKPGLNISTLNLP